MKFANRSKEEMAMISDYHRQIQAMIAILATRKLTEIPMDNIHGIYKFEGGVEVNGHEICIQNGYVYDDLEPGKEPTPEEKATVEVIEQILGAVNFTNEETARESLIEFTTDNLNMRDHVLVERYMRNSMADPLRMFFQLC